MEFNNGATMLLSFDIEEFDLTLENGGELPLQEQLAISAYGLDRILGVLERAQVKATFYCTVVFAEANIAMIERVVAAGHEIASHGYYHSSFDISHLAISKDVLESITGVSVRGYRSARMREIDSAHLYKAGYLYNSSSNPTYIPGRYNNLSQPRSLHSTHGIIQLPASVAHPLRVPLFWLSFHNFPTWLYRLLALSAIKKDGYLNVYFHPWEFYDRLSRSELRVQSYIRRNSGVRLEQRLEKFIEFLKSHGVVFSTTESYLIERL